MWRDIPGYEGYYQVSDDGRVRSLTRTLSNGTGHHVKEGAELTIAISKLGYPCCALSQNGKSRRITVHRLMGLAFLGEPKGRLVHHKNHNPLDNRLENLEYMAQADHIKHHHNGESNAQAKLREGDIREIRRLLGEGMQGKDIAAKFKVGKMEISRIKNGARWAHVT
jgi:hypothetical protein